MKNLITIVALTLSLGAFAQERVVLTKNTSVATDRAFLVRTSSTQDKVQVTFNNIPMSRRECVGQETVRVPRQCSRTIYRKETRCTYETPTSTRPAGSPTGPRYNPPTPTPVRVCRDVQAPAGTQYYDCSYLTTQCIYETRTRPESDSVNIKFKDLPTLGGTEEDVFEVIASQASFDHENVVYTFIHRSDLSGNRQYHIEKKRILGFDSYVIEPK